MRTRVTSILSLSLSLGCVYEPAELGRFETSDEGAASDPSFGNGSVDWDQVDLCEGASLMADLGAIDMEVITLGHAVHDVVIEVVPIQPPTLPAGFSASIHALDEAEVQFEVTETGLRFEGPLQLGWSAMLHADEPSIVELRAKISSEGANCETEYAPHPFLNTPCPQTGAALIDGMPNWDPACGLICNTLEVGATGWGYAWCNIQCEDVGDCAGWNPGESVVSCVDGECAWFCDESHHCPSELECGPPYYDPDWGHCTTRYTP